MLSIKNNMMSVTAAMNLGKAYDALSTSVQRLSSGLRINGAKDDAAGLAVSELIRSNVATLQQGARNAQDGISMLQTSEGALGAVDDILVRMKELAEQAATESYSADQRSVMNDEFSSDIAELNRIVNNTSFNGIDILNQTGQTYKIHLGTTDTVDIETMDLQTGAGLGLGTKGSGVSAAAADTTTPFVTGAAGDKLTLTFVSDNNHDTDVLDAGDTISFDVAVEGDMSMTQLAASINAQSLAQDPSWQAASIVQDTVTGYYHLKLETPVSSANATVSVAGTDAGGDSSLVFGAAAVGGLATTEIPAVGAAFTGTTGNAGADLTDANSAKDALDAVQNAIKVKDAYRAKLGYLMNRLDAATNVINIQAQNLQTAQSRIADVDVATEMATMTRNQVLAQAGISMLGKANQMPQMAMQLLQG